MSDGETKPSSLLQTLVDANAVGGSVREAIAMFTRSLREERAEVVALRSRVAKLESRVATLSGANAAGAAYVGRAGPGARPLLQLRRISAGGFQMGSLLNEVGREKIELPHPVRLTYPFAIAEAPITQREFELVEEKNPSHFRGPQRPVECVSFLDAVNFCNSLSRREGLEEAYVFEKNVVRWAGPGSPGYRLPTEAEWEYACRAGSLDARYGALDEIAWFSGTCASPGAAVAGPSASTRDVKGKRPNAWGLYDMLGNVTEWCWDWYGAYPSGLCIDPIGPQEGTTRVVRGGSFRGAASAVRAAVRSGVGCTVHDVRPELGFRVVRTLAREDAETEA